MLPSRDNTEQGVAREAVTVLTVNQFSQTLIQRHLHDGLLGGDLVWKVIGYLGTVENKLRTNQTFWGVTLSEHQTGSADSLKLAIPKHVLDRSGTQHGDYVAATGTLRISQQFRSSSFEVYLAVTDLRPLDAPAAAHLRRQETSILQTLKSLTVSRHPFPTKAKPNMAVIHSRSQEAQVYADFCQPLGSVDTSLSMQPVPTNMLSASEIAHAIRAARTDIVVLIRGGGNEEQFAVFEDPDLLRAWSDTSAYRVVGLGHSANSTALDWLSDYVAATPSAAGTHIAEMLRSTRDTQQQLAQLRTQNDELRMQLRQTQLQQTPPVFAPPLQLPVQPTTQARSARTPTALTLVLALLIGIVAGVLLLLWFTNRH